jgi:uncharacterized protein (TIGR02001 family)
MRKSLITTAVLGALVAPSFVFAAEAAPAPDLTVAYNVGLYSQYIFRGLTQTDRHPAIQGGIDLTHSSGFYLGAWASNVSWLRDPYGENQTDSSTSYYSKGGRMELDLYGGYRYTFSSGLGIDVGALRYQYPGSLRPSTVAANTTELYGALNYGWVQAKLSSVVTDTAWGWGKHNGAGTDDARGTYYAEINTTVPIGDLIGGGALTGVTGLVHIARQDFNGKANEYASYTDYKLGLQKSFSEGVLNGVNIGGYWTKANTNGSAWTYDTKNIGDSTGTAYIQKTF